MFDAITHYVGDSSLQGMGHDIRKIPFVNYDFVRMFLSDRLIVYKCMYTTHKYYYLFIKIVYN